VGEQRGIGDRLARQETERGHRRLLGGVQARRSLTALAHALNAVGRQVRPRVHHDESCGALGVPRGERH